MRKIVMTLSAMLLCVNVMFAQAPNMSDGHTPPPIPPPVKKPCKLISFSLPCCSDKATDIKDIAQVKTEGPDANVVFNPNRASLPSLYATDTTTVSASACGKTLTAQIVMVNSDRKILAKNEPILDKLNKINDIANQKFKPMLEKTNKLLNKYLSFIGDFQSELKLGFNFGGEAYKICCPGQSPCIKSAYKVFGEGEAGLLGKCPIPVTGLPVIGKYLGGVDVVVTLGFSLVVNVNAKTTCQSMAVCVNPEAKVTGGGGFAFKVAGFKAEGQALLDGGGVSSEICLLPDFEVKCVKFNTGKIKLVGNVSDKWGWVTVNFEYVVWDGASFPIYGCN